MKIVLLIIAIKIFFSFGKNIIELNNESFNKIVESNKYDKNKKLIVIFYTNNCKYCQEALNVISNEIIDKYNSDNKIDFGKINCDLKENVWLNIRFNITRIPYIILVKGKYYSELNSNYDKYELNDFINTPKDNKDLLLIPNDINMVQKRIIVTKYTINYVKDFFKSKFNIDLHQNIIIFILILSLILFLWLIKLLLEFCCYMFGICKKKKVKKEIVIASKDNDTSGLSGDVSGSDLNSKGDDSDSYISGITDSLFKEEMDDKEVKKIKEKID